jgi:hypothetical protein
MILKTPISTFWRTYVLSPFLIRKSVLSLECRLYVRIYTVCACLNVRLRRISSYSVLTNLYIIPVSINTPAPKREALQMSPKTRNGDFFENSCNNFDYILLIYGDYLQKYNSIVGHLVLVQIQELSHDQFREKWTVALNIFFDVRCPSSNSSVSDLPCKTILERLNEFIG